MPVEVNLGPLGRRQFEARHAAHTRRWMEAQPTNVLAEARNPRTSAERLHELAANGSAKVRTSVACNRNASPEVLVFLSSRDFITSEISQRLVNNPNTPLEALRNVNASQFRTWFGNYQKLQNHPNWQ